MEIDDKSTVNKETDKENADKEKAKEKEPDFELLQNPSRVIKPQLKVISQPKNSRYQPLKEFSCGGIIILRDTQSDQAETLVEIVKAGGPVKEEDTSEPEPPEPFAWNED